MVKRMRREDGKEAAHAFNEASEGDVKTAVKRVKEGDVSSLQGTLATPSMTVVVVTGVLVDPEGTPLAEKEVGAWTSRTEGKGVERAAPTTTDTSGAFRLAVNVPSTTAERQELIGHLYWGVAVPDLEFGPSIEDAKGKAISFRLSPGTPSLNLGMIRVRPGPAQAK
jgi:hypothetical protein